MGLFTVTHEKPPATCCAVATESCKAPANVDLPKRCRTSCFACGLPVCTDSGCSRVYKYFEYGRKRICADCALMHGLEPEEKMVGG